VNGLRGLLSLCEESVWRRGYEASADQVYGIMGEVLDFAVCRPVYEADPGPPRGRLGRKDTGALLKRREGVKAANRLQVQSALGLELRRRGLKPGAQNVFISVAKKTKHKPEAGYPEELSEFLSHVDQEAVEDLEAAAPPGGSPGVVLRGG